MNEHEKLLEMIKKKIESLENNSSHCLDDEYVRLKKIYGLVNNNYGNFFSNIDINVAISILNDIGINEDELELYQKLLKEEIHKFVLIDEDQIKKNL